MNNRSLGLLIAMLALFNVGAVISLIFALGHGDWHGLSTLAWMLGIDAFGFWLLRQLRD
ncbi:hypothetical protein [Deinococcus sp.]|uniref:hypothetical protein n=1 Tax=Deinococcus sp. TaxID=47478 RepID=UPI0025DEA0CB|nr:hypothetical protein [Deinococcus sp.]